MSSSNAVAEKPLNAESRQARRVLHVHSGNMYGGVEATLRTLARNQSPAWGFEHVFALCFEGRFSRQLTSDGIKVYPLPNVRVRKPWTLLRARRTLAALISRERIDVVICHMPWSQAIFGGVVENLGCPLIFWAHDIHSGDHWLERWAARTHPTLCLVNSEVTGQGVAKIFPALPRRVLHCPVEKPSVSPEVRSKKRAELAVAPGQRVILQVSRLERWKGHFVHLRALAALLDRDDWICWIAGGPQRPDETLLYTELQREAARLGLADRVKFLGQRWDVQELMWAADIFCQPNTSPEPFGLVFVEALYAGLPVVTFRMGGAGEIVNDQCALLVEPGDTIAISDRLRKLLDCPLLRQELSARGPSRAREISDPATQMKQLSNFLELAIN